MALKLKNWRNTLKITTCCHFLTLNSQQFALTLLSFELGTPNLCLTQISTHVANSLILNDYLLLLISFPLQNMKNPVNNVIFAFFIKSLIFTKFGTCGTTHTFAVCQPVLEKWKKIDAFKKLFMYQNIITTSYV